MTERQNASDAPANTEGSDDSGIQDSENSVEVLPAGVIGARLPDSVLFPGVFVKPLQAHLDRDSPKFSENESHLSSCSKQPDTTADNPRKEYFCGFGRCRPKWMQRFMDARVFTLLLCINSLVEGALVSGFTSVVLSSIERRYRFPSVAVGFIAATFDMAVLVSVVFISYFGGRGHKPRWLGVGLLIQGLGAFVFALPQFLLGEYTIGSALLTEQFESCDAGIDLSPSCATSDYYALVFFIVGNILIGVGAAPLFTIGTSYLDDIVHPKQVSIHLGFFYMVSIIGPALGYGLGGAFLSVYVDPWIDTNLEPSDPSWVGAWWVCFIFSGAMSWLVSIPYFMFPRLLPDSHLVKLEREKEMAQRYTGKYGKREETDFSVKVKSFPAHLKQVITTPSWIFISASICSSIIVLAGMVSFAPKYLEAQFSLTASSASLIAGGVAIPAGGVGVITGALIIYLSKSTGRRVALINWIVALATIFPTLVFLLHCPTLELAGVTAEYSDGLTGASDTRFLNSTCIMDCACNSTLFEPVCGADNLTYFSPCRASCHKTIIDNVEVLENCGCVAESFAQTLNTSYSMNSNLTQVTSDLLANSTATDGRCEQGCNNLQLFLVFIAIALFLIFMLQVPYTIITVRCVADEQRTLALGLQSLLFRALGSIPGPIVFGLIFDSACLFWQYTCSRRGNCWLYSNKLLSNRALSLSISGVILNFIFSFLCWVVYPKQYQLSKETVQKNSLDQAPEITASENDDTNGQDENAGSISLDMVYILQGPSYSPQKRTSKTRCGNHCSDNIVLDRNYVDSPTNKRSTSGSTLQDMKVHSIEGQKMKNPNTRFVVRNPTDITTCS